MSYYGDPDRQVSHVVRVAIHRADIEVIELFMKYGLDVNKPHLLFKQEMRPPGAVNSNLPQEFQGLDKRPLSLLSMACQIPSIDPKHCRMIQFLIDQGANVNGHEEEVMSPLIFACIIH